MTTIGGLVSDIEDHLYSFGMQRDKVTSLVNAVSTTDLHLAVADARQVDRGFLEIGQEMMAVASIDAAANRVVLHPWGRGQRGTQVVAHAAQSKVVASPRFPRSAIAKAVQRTIDSMYPDLYRVYTDETHRSTPTQVSYPLPANADSIIAVSVQMPGPSREWVRITRWRLNHEAKTLDIYQGAAVGRPLRIVYRAAFGKFTSEGTTLASIGLQDRWSDIIIFGTSANLILGMEALRLQSDAVETQERAEGVQPTAATSVARQLLGMFKQRIIEERSLLYRQNPPTMTRHI